MFSLYFTSPTWGMMSLQQIKDNIQAYLNEDAQAPYKVVIGTDSHTHYDQTVFVTALVIHRVGKGARFFFRKSRNKPLLDLRHRIYRETELSLDVIEKLKENGLLDLVTDWPFEIHVDIGRNGETRKLIHEIVGWIQAVGYVAKIKPDSFGANSVADRYTG